MRIKISEVWNHLGQSETLAVIEVPNNRREAVLAIMDWIPKHHPDLFLATGLNDHGYHVIATNDPIFPAVEPTPATLTTAGSISKGGVR